MPASLKAGTMTEMWVTLDTRQFLRGSEPSACQSYKRKKAKRACSLETITLHGCECLCCREPVRLVEKPMKN